MIYYTKNSKLFRNIVKSLYKNNINLYNINNEYIYVIINNLTNVVSIVFSIFDKLSDAQLLTKKQF